MEPVIELDGARVFHGDCVEVLKTLPENSVDAVVTDPPYGLEFMGKDWDRLQFEGGGNEGKVSGTGINRNSPRFYYQKGSEQQAWHYRWVVECLRVLKPGGHLLAFGGTRTWHRLAVAVEDAGFEVRDSIAWMYGSGFPKSLDISKAIEKKAGVEPVGAIENEGGGFYGENSGWNPTPRQLMMPETQTAEGKQWQGWGTALKPAFEPIVVARKPLSGTVAETVLEWGTGGLNIDGSRIASTGEHKKPFQPTNKEREVFGAQKGFQPSNAEGRWPANVILDEVTAGLLDEQSGIQKDGRTIIKNPEPGAMRKNEVYNKGWGKLPEDKTYGGSGGASRFFYCAKASRRDRNEGLEELETRSAADTVEREEGSPGMESPRAGAGRTSGAKNFHPTVKPTALMRYLVKLVTPPGGTVLDPFTGSGSTGKAAILEGFDFVGVELTDDYLPIIEGRLKWALENQDEGRLF